VHGFGGGDGSAAPPFSAASIMSAELGGLSMQITAPCNEYKQRQSKRES
jgi:hypothetical protein